MKTTSGDTLTWAKHFGIDCFDTDDEAGNKVEAMLRKNKYRFWYNPLKDIWTVVDKRVKNA